MNIHHLELFYYVARYGGISEAVRKMPYGIQQPAMSGQVRLLEECLGVTLFQRRPFALTPPGQELYDFIRPFFDNLDQVEAQLRGTIPRINIGASEIVLRDHLPPVLEVVRKKFPGLRVTLRAGYQPELEGWLQKKELDLAITLLDEKPPAGIQTRPLLKVPLVLIVPKASPWRAAQDIWKRDRIDDALICLPTNDAICRTFQKGLAEAGLDWAPGIEVSSFDLIEGYVANGYGIGLAVAVPQGKPSPKVRVLPLTDFPQVTIGALWVGRINPVTQCFLDAMQAKAKEMLK